jgi:putative SbcD/Mre11-related phosphoesterase
MTSSASPQDGAVVVHGEWELTPWRAAVHLPTATAVIADVHLGYDRARRRKGDAVPLIPVEEQMAPLLALAAATEVRRLIVAGDLFEMRPGFELVQEFLCCLAEAKMELVAVIPGNHDRHIGKHRFYLPLRERTIALGGWTLQHGDGKLSTGPVVHGHIHPAVRLSKRQLAPCYLVAPGRIVLPAFSQEAAGFNIVGDRKWGKMERFHIEGGRVHASRTRSIASPQAAGISSPDPDRPGPPAAGPPATPEGSA